jgi:hypothetical protein
MLMYFHRIPVLLLCLSNCLLVAQERTLVAEGGLCDADE